MSSIISLFITFFNFLNKLSFHCSNFLKSFLSNYHDKKLFSKDFHLYRTFDVDPIPIIKPEHLPMSFDQAKAIYLYGEKRALHQSYFWLVDSHVWGFSDRS